MSKYTIRSFPKSRIATLDIGAVGKRKHHVAAMLEIDVTLARQAIKNFKSTHSQRLSFTAWLISEIGKAVKQYGDAAAYLSGKSKLIIFEDVNISMLVEKELNGQKVPIPVVIKKAQEKDALTITAEIDKAKKATLNEKDMVIQRKNSRLEDLYHYLPGFLRRMVWAILLKRPEWAYDKMGNVAFTAIGMMGQVNGWFLPISVHPLCFGVGSIVRKPRVIGEEIVIREVLHMSVLMDHDVIDGAPMTRFISHLIQRMETAQELVNI